MPKITTEIKSLKLSEIRINPENPRTITEKDMAYLVKSLQDFPDMMKLREIVIDEDNMIIGGNMRYRALQEIGEKECLVKIVKGLTPEQKREFIIKDNGFWGRWDFDALANSWDDLPLGDWGVSVWKDWTDDKAREKRTEKDEKHAGKSMEDYVERYEIIVECDSEIEQTELLEEFITKGLKCKAIIV